jgi:hypothetical protein
MTNPPQDPKKQADVVFTPGGPRRADQVHAVGPGEMVTPGAAGQYTVARKPPDLQRTRELLATGEYAITPGGLRPKSMIHLV